MVTKIMPIHRIDLTNRDHRDATDGAEQKPQNNVPFREVLTKALSAAAKSPSARV